MTPERLQEIKKKHNQTCYDLLASEVDELIAFAELALPTMMMTDPIKNWPGWEVDKNVPSRGVVAMHLMPCMIEGFKTTWLNDLSKIFKLSAESSVEAADALIAELERKK